MRVSTAQFYFQNGLQMSQKQTTVNDQSAYISSGLSVLTAKDDAVSYGALAGYKEELASIERYQSNITQAESRNGLQDTLLGSSTDLLNELRDLMLQANNGTRSDEDLTSIAQQLQQGLDEMLDIANTQDETGTYIYAGYDVESKPFSMEPDNTVNYGGDNGVRELQIAKNIFIPINQSGEEVFQNVANATGDFSANYTVNESGVSLASATITNRDTYNSTANNPQDYTFTFSDPDLLTVTDSGGNDVYPATPYVAGQTITFEGIEVELNGNPLPGDTFTITPESQLSVFDTIKDSINWLNSGSSVASTEQGQVDFNTILNQFNNVLNHITYQQADAGINLQQIDRQKNIHLDTELYLEQGRSQIEDLDYAQAISGFEQSQLALQAAQQTFTQIQSMSLFNYI
ncbi:flagellar hook-associated protein FlgL [Pseudocolwellia sp. AS88]|uniref:flagellar hook-associated protein FlgL n=1 Tax=Pseudocolwellia sp. AS88 TaxID=3063958 RepID=UPI0026F27A14|nr:flagellar hook-associated protein FlgL [Pseudocolwellia sp. AS88]MDO7085077.1 flagellar hook-associated protein FlgL [Pseudocolwellia sp. AS88]